MKCAARTLFVCIVASIFSGTAFAGLFRAYLSFSGNDANPCTILAPCRLLPAALAAINDGGEIWMLDSANYNTAPVNITKSAKILAIPGEMGSVVGNGGDALIINVPGGTVTLRNLVVLNLAGGINGINIQDGAAVHIEKVSIDGFTTDASSCIQLAPATTNTQVYVDDSFLRGCRNGIHADGTTAPGRPAVYVDNTRIERGVNTGGTGVTTGVWMQGKMDVSLRNSVIARTTNAIQIDNLLANSFLEVINSELVRNVVGLTFANTDTGAMRISILNSQILQNGDAIIVSTTGGGSATHVKIVDSHIAYTTNTGVGLSTSTGAIRFDMIRSEILLPNIALNLVATGGADITAHVQDSTIANAGTGLMTSGSASTISAVLARSNLHNSTAAIAHGLGTVMLDGNQVTGSEKDFVNNGSGNISSAGNNFVSGNTNAADGTIYITPSIIAPK